MSKDIELKIDKLEKQSPKIHEEDEHNLEMSLKKTSSAQLSQS